MSFLYEIKPDILSWISGFFNSYNILLTFTYLEY